MSENELDVMTASLANGRKCDCRVRGLAFDSQVTVLLGIFSGFRKFLSSSTQSGIVPNGFVYGAVARMSRQFSICLQLVVLKIELSSGELSVRPEGMTVDKNALMMPMFRFFENFLEVTEVRSLEMCRVHGNRFTPYYIALVT
uniref:SFRICE_013809 n=1 Tax=Spodoptera frugiperda TaxID=7108 RepID=A0A2H1VBN4_SPOFR